MFPKLSPPFTPPGLPGHPESGVITPLSRRGSLQPEIISGFSDVTQLMGNRALGLNPRSSDLLKPTPSTRFIIGGGGGNLVQNEIAGPLVPNLLTGHA